MQTSHRDGRTIRQIERILYEYMESYGYELIDLPIIEDANLFLIKAGDQIINRLYTFEQHGKQYALRPEFTAAAIYRYLNSGPQQKPVRWQFSGPIFEDDPAGRTTRDHQQLSFGAELIGISGALADAEIITVSMHGLGQVGITDWRIVIGHTGLLRLALSRFDLDSRTQRFLLHRLAAIKESSSAIEDVVSQIDSLWPATTSETPDNHTVFHAAFPHIAAGIAMGGRTREDIARRMEQKQRRFAQRPQVIAALEFLHKWCQVSGTPETVFAQLKQLLLPDQHAALDLLQMWQETVDLLAAHNIPGDRILIRPDLSRSWEYYTGIIFELHGAGLHLGGGGRYDELARLIGSPNDIPAVGFAYYGDRLLDALPHSRVPQRRVVIVHKNTSSLHAVIHWSNVLREKGIRVQLVAENAISPADQQIIIQDDNSALVDGQSYTVDQINVLVARLMRAEEA